MARDTLFLLIAIALAIPLSVVANLLTPRLRDWWSQRSKKRLQDRISVLEHDLRIPLPPFEEMFLEVTRHISWGLVFLTMLVVLAGAFGVSSPPNKLENFDRVGMTVTLFLFYILAINHFIGAATKVASYLRHVSNSDTQNKIRARVERLKKILTKK
jgi:hypothetical protein